MSEPRSADDAAVLTVLANGIIPADARDAGAAAVNAGPRLAEKLAAGVNAGLYRPGLAAAEALARETFGRAVAELDDAQVQELLGVLRGRQPAFFRQLRADVCALYLSDPGVWARIGFPGPSTALGGYPDFDRPQRTGPREDRGA
jgi:Gluconate 2-dehydrogenase subunit 3